MAIKVLHIITGLNTGGAERALVRLIETGDRKQFEHYVVSLIDKGTQGKILEDLGIEVFEIRMRAGVLLPQKISKLRKITKFISPDIIHTWMYHAGLLSLLTGNKYQKILGIRHSLHDLSKDKLTTRFIIRLLGRLSGRFNTIIFNSSVSLQQHIALGYSTKNTNFIPNGFDCQIFKPLQNNRSALRKEMSIREDAFVIGNIGRYHKVKNHAGLIQAFSRFAKNNTNSHLVLIGKDLSNTNHSLIRLIKNLGLENRVSLLGEKTNIPELISMMDVYISSSVAEAFPNTIGEAMACGVICVATNVGDTAYLIGDTGILVNPDDTDGLVNGMNHAADLSISERKSIGKEARDRILDHFQQSTITLSYEKTYNKLFALKNTK